MNSADGKNGDVGAGYAGSNSGTRGASRGLKKLLGLFVATWLAGSAAAAQSAAPHSPGHEHTIYVISNGWHTGIAVARRDLPPGRLLEAANFPGTEFVEFGWGDEEYYMAPQPTVLMAVQAALTPSAAVIRVAALAEEPERTSDGGEVLALSLSTPELERMVAQITRELLAPTGDQTRPIAGDARRRFYSAQGRFHLFNNCNTWTARMLMAAGLPVSSFGVITAEDLLNRLSALPANRVVPGLLKRPMLGHDPFASQKASEPARRDKPS